MTTVETYRGPVDMSELGTTLVHEHVFVRNPELETNYPRSHWDEARLVKEAIDSLNSLVDKGISTMVDLTVLGLGRDVELVRKVADNTTMNIVAATGWYTRRDLPLFFHSNGPGRLIDGPDPLIEMMVKDLTVGIADTGVKAALIKVVTDEDGITSDIERTLQAAAVAHQETGATIMTHSHAALETGRLQLDYFEKAGVPLEHVVVGHCGDSTDIDYLREIMDRGTYVGLDRFGMENALSDELRCDIVAKLVELGYVDRIAMSQDAQFYSVNRPPSWREQNAPRWSHHNISDNILPALRSRGVTEETLNRILMDNAARILAGARSE